MKILVLRRFCVTKMIKNEEPNLYKQFTQKMNKKTLSRIIFLLFTTLFLGSGYATAKELLGSQQIQTKDTPNGHIRSFKSGSAKLYDKIYVISLDRTPERYALVKKQLDNFNLKHERFSAVDGKLINVRDEGRKQTIQWQKIGPPNGYYRGATLKISYKPLYEDAEFYYLTDKCLLNVGELGCAMSHRAVWIDIVKHKYKRAIVFEDDITLENNFNQKLSETLNNLPSDFDLFYLDIAVRPHELSDTKFFPPDFWLSKFSNTSSPYYAKIKSDNKNITSTHAYVITYDSAEKLLKKTKYIHVPIDASMMFSELKLYISKKKLLTGSLYNSVIFNRKKGNKK